MPYETPLDVLREQYEWIKLRELELRKEIAEYEHKYAETWDEPVPELSYGEKSEILADGVIKVTLPELIPAFNTVSYINSYRLKKEIRSHFTGMVTRALTQHQSHIQMDHALLLVVPFYPNKIIRDNDNRAYKFLIDGVRYSRIIPDDSWIHLSFMILGALDHKNPRTELYLFDMDKNVNTLLKWIESIRNLTVTK